MKLAIKLKLASLSMVMLLTTSSALAYSYVSENQFYVGIGAGYGGMLTYRPQNLPVAANNNTQYTAFTANNGVAYRAEVGYLWAKAHDQYGLEIGYMGYPKNTYDVDYVTPTLVYKGYTTDLLVVLKHNYSSGLNIFGKIGAAYVTQRLINPQENNASAPDTSVNGKSIFCTNSKILPEVALGLGYNLSQHLGIDLSANYVFAGSSGQDLAVASNADSANKIASVAAGFIGVYFQY